MNIVILNEKKDILDRIENEILLINKSFIINKYDTIEKLLDNLNSIKFYTIFIIDTIIDGINSIEIAGIINNTIEGAQIIYISQNNKYISDIFRYDPCYYIQIDELNKYLGLAINKALNRIRNQKGNLIVKNHGESILININGIRYLERNVRISVIHVVNKNYTTYESFDSLLQRLPDYFLKCHKSYIVNLKYVTAYRHNIFVLKDGINIPISRTYEKSIKCFLKSYWKL
ncbi:MAG: LytR/AlgR family response regulator transcription factor [Thomasclavelia sp.]